jgi:predicted TIM-barrel fold metal-dependent hydrolase
LSGERTLEPGAGAAEEDVLEPGLPIIDPHHHLWDDERPRYLLDELLADVRTGGHDVRATVFIECRAMYRADGPEPTRPVGEVEFANGVAAMSASGQYGDTRVCAGIVGYADLRAPELDTVLDGLERAGGGRFRGIRQMATHDPAVRVHPSPGLLRDPQFRDGFARLQRRGLSFEAWQYHPQLPELIDLMEAYPEAKVVLNHIGGRIGVGGYAGRLEEVRAEWARDVRTLARFPNLHVKLGGLGMPMCGFGFEGRAQPVASEELAAAWEPYFETCIAAFGTERCMFESNFPVDRVSCSYRALWNAFKRIARDRPAAEKDALFSRTAARFYDLAIP